jgi:hypothetical protein
MPDAVQEKLPASDMSACTQPKHRCLTSKQTVQQQPATQGPLPAEVFDNAHQPATVHAKLPLYV